MTQEEAITSIINIPLGSTIKITRTDGVEVVARLAKHDVSGTEKKDYGDITVPELPPGISIITRNHQGQTKMNLEDILKIEEVV